MDLLRGLNDAQKKAVLVTKGPLLILAGAGSGKTKTLTHRIAHLVSNENISTKNILAVTFTNKAAKEMRHRLGALLSQNSEHRDFMPWMGTFHSICVRLLRLDGSRIGIEPRFVIYDEDDRVGLIKQIMKLHNIDPKLTKPKSVSAAISNAKNELIGCEEFAQFASSPSQKTISQIYFEYEKTRKKSGALDFDDLLSETVRLLTDDPEVRNKWRSVFRHILIDEYQDTNAAQYAIVKLLVNKEENICVVGDDWQSIYSWRGADYKNILNFERDFKGATVIKLEQNYRSTGNILEAAGKVISKNKSRTEKKLWTDLGRGNPVEVHALYDEAEEARFVADRIFSQVSIGARNYDDFVVLYRTNAQSYNFERAFINSILPYQIIGGVRFYDRKEVKDVVSYLKLVYQPLDRMSFTRIANVPTRGIGEASLERFLAWQASIDRDVISALKDANMAEGLTPRAKAAFTKLGDQLYRIQKMIETATPAEIVEKLISEVGYFDYLRDGTPQAEIREENVGQLISSAQSYSSLDDFLEEISLMSSVDSRGEKGNVTLMTLHSAKGLEYPVVFIVGLEEGILPHARVFNALDESDLEEERRLMYVGMTRAREELHLCYAQSRVLFGDKTYPMPSRFISDMGETTTYRQTQDNFDEADYDIDQYYAIGDQVRSDAFGEGEIVDIDGMALTVLFKTGARKKLNVQYARLVKL